MYKQNRESKIFPPGPGLSISQIHVTFLADVFIFRTPDLKKKKKVFLIDIC